MMRTRRDLLGLSNRPSAWSGRIRLTLVPEVIPGPVGTGVETDLRGSL